MFELYTVVDITMTGARRGGAKFEENQQQNFLTVQNTLSMRSNPTIVRTPYIIPNEHKFGSAYADVSKVWAMRFEFEYGSYGVDVMESDIDLVPFIAGLTEQVEFEDAVFRTNSAQFCNIIFKELDK